MEYIEKAKYELIMSLKNNEPQNIIDFLKQYYTDMIKIVSQTNNKILKKKVNYVLNFYDSFEELNKKESFIFTDKTKLIEFYEKYKETGKNITISEFHDINPENNFRPNIEININNWLNNK